MKKTIVLSSIFTLLIISFAGIGTFSMNDLESGDYVLIGKSSSQDWGGINSYGTEAVYRFQEKDTNGVMLVNLMKATLKKKSKGAYYVKGLYTPHLTEDIYQRVFWSKDTLLKHPEYSPRGQQILFLADDSSFKNKPVVFNTRYKTFEFTDLTNLNVVSWSSESELFVCFNDDKKKLYRYNLDFKDTTLVKEFDYDIVSINKQKTNILMGFDGRLENYNTRFEYQDGYPVRFNYEKAYLVNDLTLITTNSKEYSVMIDFNNNSLTRMIPGNNDVNPVLSNDKRNVISYSKTLQGMVIRKM